MKTTSTVLALASSLLLGGAALSGFSFASPSPPALYFNLAEGDFLPTGDDLGGLPLVTNDGPGSVTVDILDGNGDVTASFGLAAGRWRQAVIPPNGSLEICDDPDPLSLGSSGTAE